MNKKKLSVATMIALGLGASAPVLAQNTDQSEDTVSEEVVVTAIPKSAGAVTFRQMASEAMAAVPGISAEEAHRQMEEDQMNTSLGSLNLKADMVAEALTEVSAVSPGEALQRIQQNPMTLVVDVRDPLEWAAGHLRGSQHTYVPDIATGGLQDVDPAKPVWLVCRTGNRATIAAGLLERRNLTPVVVTKGGVPDALPGA